ncbi:MAG: acyl-CoA dehydrogenase family protein [Moraxellaceae bacterium]
MDFSLNDDQKLLRDSVAKFVKGSYDFEARRRRVRELASFDATLWQQMADLGWLALPFAEADGGIGGTLVDTMILLEEFGRGLVVEPYLPTVVLGGGFLRRGTAQQRAKWLPALLEGRLQMAFAVHEYERAGHIENTAMTARRDGHAIILDGVKQLVLNGDKADLLVVLARSAGQPGERDGLSLLLVDARAEGVERIAHRTVDGGMAAEIRFQRVVLGDDAIIGSWQQGAKLADAVIDEAILALGAEATGALSVLLYGTVEYSKQRKQFGVPIGSFQALQFRMADMFMRYEQTRSLLLCATLKVQEGHADARQAVHALKVQLGTAGRRIAQDAIQIHGGMGMTDELNIGHYFKRLTAIDALFGNADHHLRAYAAAS